MILKNLFTGQQWRNRQREQAYGRGDTWDLLNEITIILITSTIVWPLVKQQGGNTALPINR